MKAQIIISTGCTTCGKSLFAQNFIRHINNDAFIRIERDPIYRRLILLCLRHKNFDIYMRVFEELKEKLLFFTTYSDALNYENRHLFMPYEEKLIESMQLNYKKLFYLKDDILALRKEFQRYDEKIRKLATSVCISLAMKAFNSGTSSIIDAVFYHDDFCMFPVKPLILLNYAPMKILKRRIQIRNEDAIRDQKWYNYRTLINCRKQFAKIFSPQKIYNTKPLDFLDLKDAAVCKFYPPPSLKKIPIFSTYKYDICIKSKYF